MIKFILFFFFLFPPLVQAEPVSLRVAVAANFINALEALAPLYTAEHDDKLQPTFGSSGKLYAQIKNGAPYDLFLSADQKRPMLLHKAGICDEPSRYAMGADVLWTWDTKNMSGSWQEALESHIGKVAIANPATAPYGTVAHQALQENGLAETITPRLVYGQSAAQTFVFVQTRNTHFGLIPLSLALSDQGRMGRFWPIPEAKAVGQWGCIVKASKNKEAAQYLLSLFASEVANEIFHNLGYTK